MIPKDELQIQLQEYSPKTVSATYDLNAIIFDLDSQIDLLSSKADNYDYLVSIASGVLSGLLDVLWVGEFSLEQGRDIASDKIDGLVVKVAKLLGCEQDDLTSAIRFLEKQFPIPADGNTPDFGGGLQHHLRDFAHHPTIVGLIFSLLTQFTYKSYGTDTHGNFCIVDVTEKSRIFIGDDVPTKILYGTLHWFFHLVSDIAGSSNTAAKSGGTGIPGPLLALAKELSVLPIFKNMDVGGNSLSVFISKLFNGTFFAKRDEEGTLIRETIVKLDLRGEFGVGIELGKQTIPVIANECIVRTFYFIRRLAMEIQSSGARSISELNRIDWDRIKPFNNPTIDRMLTIATGVFTTVDVGDAVISKKYLVSINYVGVGRFAIAIGADVSWCLKARHVEQIRQVYLTIRRFVYMQQNQDIYERMREDVNIDRFGLTLEQTEFLYSLEYHKIWNDIEATRLPIGKGEIRELKQEWLEEWKTFISENFASFVQIDDAELHWYSKEELVERVEENDPRQTWFRLILLEAMLFEPYFALGVEQGKDGKTVPSTKYRRLHMPTVGYSKSSGDAYLNSFFSGDYYPPGYVRRLRKCYNKVLLEMNEVLKGVLIGSVLTVGVAAITIATAGAFAPAIATALVGSNFAGLSGAALTSACLAYLGGGAIAAGGAGMAGGTIAIVGGGAILGTGAGAVVGGAAGAATIMGKQDTILQSAKLLVSVREIFLNDEHDIDYSNTVYEQYVNDIIDIEEKLIRLRLRADVATDGEKDSLMKEIKELEKSVAAMKIARKSLLKFKSSFEEGMSHA